jgi:hypothetical protein
VVLHQRLGDHVITFNATVSQVRTLADGGLRVVLDLQEQDILQAAELMECKRQGVVIQVTAEPV